jgi:hypothetical protein
MSDLLAELRSKWGEVLASGTTSREWRGIALSRPSSVRLLAGIRDRDGRISILIETPLDGIHDFQAAGVAVEVKATIGLSHHIRISRLDQLDSGGLGTLVLLRARFHEALEGFTLPEVLDASRKRIELGSPGAVAEFADKLMRTGYLDADAEIYGATRVMLNDLQGFRVGEGFPRLIRATVPPAVVDAAYSLDERQLGPFRIASEELRTVMRQMGGS